MFIKWLIILKLCMVNLLLGCGVPYIYKDTSNRDMKVGSIDTNSEEAVIDDRSHGWVIVKTDTRTEKDKRSTKQAEKRNHRYGHRRLLSQLPISAAIATDTVSQEWAFQPHLKLKTILYISACMHHILFLRTWLVL